MFAFGKLPADILQMTVHFLGIRLVAHMSDRIAGLGTGRREQVDIAVPVVPRYARACSLPGPDP